MRVGESLALFAVTYIGLTLAAIPAALADRLRLADEIFLGRRILLAALVAYSFEIVDYLRATYVERTATDLLRNSTDERGKQAFLNWFWRLFAILRQTVCAAAGGAIGAGSVLYAMRPDGFWDAFAKTLDGFCLGWCGVHGLYFAVWIPTLAPEILAQCMAFDWLRPGETLWVRRVSGMFFAMSMGVLAPSAVAFPTLVRVLEQTPFRALAERALLAWLVVVCLTLFYGLFLPRWFIGRMLKRQHDTDIAEIQNALQIHRGMVQFGNLRRAAHPLIHAYEVAIGGRQATISAREAIGLVVTIPAPLLSPENRHTIGQLLDKLPHFR